MIEAAHYREEEERLVADPDIIAMAEELIENGLSEEYLADRDSMQAAYGEAERRGVKFDSIGGPDRAIRRILLERAVLAALDVDRIVVEPYHDGTSPHSRYEED